MIRNIKNNTFETLIGTFVLIVAIIFVYIAMKVSNNTQNMKAGYKVIAEFSNIDGINIGSDVKIAGVKVGSVTDILLNSQDYKAILTIKFQKDVLVPSDSLFKVSTSGLIGAKYINVKVGNEEDFFKNGDKADFTESTMDLEDLIGRYVFNNENKNEKKAK